MSGKSRQTSNSKVQMTLSKFFSNSTTKSKSSNSTTDKGDEFEVKKPHSSNKTKKRSHDDVDEHSPREKKKCIKKGSDIPEGSKSSGGTKSKVKSSPSTKLSKFSHDEADDEDESLNGNDLLANSSKDVSHITSAPKNRENGSSKKAEGSSSKKAEGSSSKKAEGSSSKKAEGSFSQLLKDNSKKGVAAPNVKYTPLEQQFVDIKKQHPDAVLFVECGYKYRFFGEDAEIAAKVLKIFCHLDHNFMTASIPVHRLFVHVRRLVAVGYKVGVVKQTETAHLKAAGDNKSAPFSRQLSGLYTKSTLIGEDVDPLTGKSEESEDIEETHLRPNNYLMCVWEDKISTFSNKTQIGLVSVDPATGDIVHDSFLDGTSYFELETRITHLQPAEIIISTSTSATLRKIIFNLAALSEKEDDRIRVEEIEDDKFTKEDALTSVSEFFKKDQNSLQTVIALPKAVQRCIAVLIDYLKDFNLHRVLALTSNFLPFTTRSKYMHLSSQCLRNLEIFHNSCDGSQKGSLFGILNHTCTKFGSRLLKTWIAQPLLNASEINTRLDAVAELQSGSMPELKNIREMMSKLPDLERGLCSIFHQKCSPYEFYGVTTSLERVRKQFLQLAVKAKDSLTSSLLLNLVDNIPELLSDVSIYSKSLDEKAAKAKDKPKLFCDDSQFPAIGQRKEEIAEMMSKITDHRKDIRLKLKQPGLTFVTVSQTEFLIEVKNNALKSVPSDWTQISSTKQVSRFHSPFIVKNYRTLNGLRERLGMDVDQAWQTFQEQFASKYSQYRKALKCLATLDCLMSLAQTASQDAFCRPQVSADEMQLNIKQGRHPIIDALNSEHEQYMPNDASLGVNDCRVMIISGPNMGGKSSYIRQVALISIMAQIGSYVPAESAHLGVLDGIYTRMGAADEIFKGRSTFMVELLEANEIMSQATGRSLIILDELGRGTSTHDGVAIAHATLKHFVTKTENLVLFVTHFPLLAEFQDLYPNVVHNYHMSFIVNKSNEEEEKDVEAITFLYQLIEGAAEKSYGLNVARLANIPQGIIKNAAVKSQELEGRMNEKLNQLKTFIRINQWQAEDGTEVLTIQSS